MRTGPLLHTSHCSSSLCFPEAGFLCDRVAILIPLSPSKQVYGTFDYMIGPCVAPVLQRLSNIFREFSVRVLIESKAIIFIPIFLFGVVNDNDVFSVFHYY